MDEQTLNGEELSMETALIIRTLAALIPVVVELAEQRDIIVDVPSLAKLKELNAELAGLKDLH